MSANGQGVSHNDRLFVNVNSTPIILHIFLSTSEPFSGKVFNTIVLFKWVSLPYNGKRFVQYFQHFIKTKRKLYIVTNCISRIEAQVSLFLTVDSAVLAWPQFEPEFHRPLFIFHNLI